MRPPGRTDAGHRVYHTADITRLQQIVALRQMGLGLEDVQHALDSPAFEPRALLQSQLARTREQIGLLQQLQERLEALDRRLAASMPVAPEEFLHLVEVTNMVGKYYTPEQMEYLRQRREQVGEERIHAAEQEWPKLMDEVRTEMQRGADPTSPVLALAGAR